MKSSRISSRSLRVLGVFLAFAGFAIWGFSPWQASIRAASEARGLFGALGTGEEESLRDASVLVALSHASRRVRTAFLREALKSEEAADKLRLHQHGLSVALSQVDYAEAANLYQAALRPVLLDSPGPAVLRECFALLSRWSLISQISPADASAIASGLTARMPVEREAEALTQFASAIIELSPRVDGKAAALLAAKLFEYALTGREQSAVNAASRSAIAPAAQLSPESRLEFASRLAARLSAERNRGVLQALAPALSALGVALPPDAAGDMAESLVNRMAGEWDAGSLAALVPAFRRVAGQADPARAQRIAVNLLQHVKLEPDPSLLPLLTQALEGFGDKLPHSTYEEAADALLKRIQTERNPGTLSALATSLGLLKGKAGAKQFEEASSQIASRMETEHKVETLAVLAAAIDSVADDLEPRVAGRLSSALVARMMQEHDAGSLLYLAAGLQPIADEAEGQDAAVLVARLTSRMREERSSYVLRSLAFSAGAFNNANENLDAAAQLLVSRMAEENNPEELRALTSALYSLRNKAGAPSFAKAASILAARIQAESDPVATRSLVASLHALKEKAVSEPFEQAASAIVANARNVDVLEQGLRRIASKLRTAKAQELAVILAGRLELEKDPNALRVLGQALADLPAGPLHLNTDPLLAIPQAPCQISYSASQLFNPLCNENGWNDLAAGVLNAKLRAPKDDIEPDFTQLAPDDDDGPASLPDDDQSLDFHKLSDALAAFRPSQEPFLEFARLRWPGIALFISAGLVFLYSARRRAG